MGVKTRLRKEPCVLGVSAPLRFVLSGRRPPTGGQVVVLVVGQLLDAAPIGSHAKELVVALGGRVRDIDHPLPVGRPGRLKVVGVLRAGHVDGIGVIRSIKKETNAISKKIELNPSLMKYMMVKGSVSIDGTSLTVFHVDRTSITISLIPTTQSDSLLGQKGIGEKVNIECDMLAKYSERLQTSSTNMSKEWLQEHGF